MAVHQNFTVTRIHKWNALKLGYENLERLMGRHPRRYNNRTPTMHDERFHDELSDEFWLAERNYYLTDFL
jgi:hypothetical protein